jgi:hypothetical protein
MPRKLRFNPDDRLVEATEKQLGQRIPEPLHERLDELCDRVYESGAHSRPTKADLISAIILAAPEDPAELKAMLAQYGQARVRDALVGIGPSDAAVIELAPRRPGPRRSART